MALMHPQSCDSIHAGLDVFSVPATQTSVEEGNFVEYHPLSTLAPNAPIEFAVSGATTDYLDLSNTFLHIKAKVTNPDGTNLADDADVAPVCNLLHSLFSQVDVTLNDTLISASENTYHYRSYIETTLNFGAEAKNSHLTSALYFRDTPGQLDATQGNDNRGLQKRRTLAAESKELDLMGRLHTDIMHQIRYMLPGVDVKLRLIPSKNLFHLMAHNQAGGFRTVITHASLFVRKVKLNPAVSLAHEKALQRGTAKYPLKRVMVKTFAIPQNNFGAIQDNLFLSQLPTRVVIGLVDTAAFNGRFNRNPFHFKHRDLNFLCLYMNGRQVPGKPLTPDYENGAYVRSYHGLMTNIGLANKDEGCSISYDDFGRGFTLYAFDLTPSLLDGDVFELLKSGALRLEMKFREALPEPTTCIVYSELDGLLEVDRSRQVLTDFAV